MLIWLSFQSRSLVSAVAAMSWESIAAKKRQALKDAIPAEWVIPAAILPPEDQLDVTSFPQKSGFFADSELEITATPAQTILSRLASGSWTAEEVTKAFCKAAAAAQQLVILATFYLYDIAK